MEALDLNQGKLALREISKSFGATDVIRGVSLEVQPGEFVAFVGPSGCGKSTMLRLIAGLETPGGGSISIDDADVTATHPSQRGIAMVFQSYALYPHMSVADNMGFALKIAGHPKAEIRARVEQAADILQLRPMLARKPRELSGGQRQRVAIGRAIVRQPKVFLFDEPLSNLDAALRGQMRAELARLHGQLGTTMIYVTHDQVEAMTLADRIVVFNGGRVEQVGTPMALYERPANRFVAEFIGSPRMNVIDARVAARDAGRALLDVGGARLLVETADDALAPGERVGVGIRPECLSLAGEGLDGCIELVERLGSETLVHVRLADGATTVVMRQPGDLRQGRGQSVRLRIDPGALHVFAADGRSLPLRRAMAA